VTDFADRSVLVNRHRPPPMAAETLGLKAGYAPPVTNILTRKRK